MAVPQGAATAEIARLAERWAGDAQPGWAQVAAVVRHLRESCQYAPNAVVPAECHDAVGHFLLDSHRGPDYLFASAAAILLRHLGYPTRVVSGFYAAPKNFDARSRHTPVLARDVHFWAEADLGCRCWATVEATPGYEVLGPPAGIAQAVPGGIASRGALVLAHAAALAAGCVGAAPWPSFGVASWISFSAASGSSPRTGRRRAPCACDGPPVGSSLPLGGAAPAGLPYAGAVVRRPRRRGRNACRPATAAVSGDGELVLLRPGRGETPGAAWTRQEIREMCRWAIRFWSLRRIRTGSINLKEGVLPCHPSSN